MEKQELHENTIEASATRTHKDTLFRFIFSGENERSKGWLLSLYNALNGSNYSDKTELQITTIQNVIFITMKDDISFLIDSDMNLYEHQSTVNPNMPLRGLMYFAKLYQKELSRRNQQLYGSAIIKIPSPKFVVFYNGTTEQADMLKYRLSDAFEKPSEPGEFEWTATVINVSANHNEVLQKKCKALYDYGIFVANVRKRIAKGQATDEAVKAAVVDGINDKLLDGLFEEQKMEIIGMSLTEFDKEAYEKTIREEGREQKALEAAENLIKLEKLTVEQIAQSMGLPLETVKQLAEKLKIPAHA